MGRLVLEVTYGIGITKSIGAEVASWNLESMKLVNEAFFEFWLVDIFHFCKYSSGHIHCLFKCCISTFHPELDPRFHIQVCMFLSIVKQFSRVMHVGRSAIGRHGCRIKSDTNHSRL
jgi:hypothetical protein